MDDTKEFKRIKKLYKAGKLKELEPIPGMKIRRGHRPKFWIPFSDPHWLRVENAAHMRPDDPVLGFHVKDQSYAIPWWIIKNHHVANLVFDGASVVIALCEACSSSSAYYAVNDGKPLTFEVAGAYKGSFVTKDHQTTSYWAPFFGEALAGPLQGTTLERFPVFQSDWRQWSELYPKTFVPDGDENQRKGHGSECSPGSFERDHGIANTLDAPDERLPHNKLVLGVYSGENAVALQLSNLPRDGVVMNEKIAERKIAVFYQPRSWMAMAYDCQMDDAVLEFISSEGKIVDTMTKSVWDMSGACIDGALRGRKLTFVRSGILEWHMWAAYRPRTLIK